MRAFLGLLSEDSRRLRYFSGGADLDGAAGAAVDVTYPGSYGIVATRGNDRIVAHATYCSATEDRAEVAFAVADELQGMGIATTLLAHPADAAEAGGIRWFEAEVLPENHRMVEVFRDSGFAVRTHSVPGAIHLEFPTTLGAEARRRFDERESLAAAAAVRSFLVLVVGCRGSVEAAGNGRPRDPAQRVGGRIHGSHLRRERARENRVRVGVKALIVLSAGFAESGAAGAARQRELVDVCRNSSMRLVGPNCLGVLNTDPSVRLNATFAPSFPPGGRVGFRRGGDARGRRP